MLIAGRLVGGRHSFRLPSHRPIRIVLWMQRTPWIVGSLYPSIRNHRFQSLKGNFKRGVAGVWVRKLPAEDVLQSFENIIESRGALQYVYQELIGTIDRQNLASSRIAWAGKNSPRLVSRAVLP